jgi:hypothetical protein
MWERIDEIAERREMSASEWIEGLVTRHFETLEDSRKSEQTTQPIAAGVFDG